MLEVLANANLNNFKLGRNRQSTQKNPMYAIFQQMLHQRY
jgi:hypothetical protein